MITNFRDIGGVTVPTGVISEKFFYRSGQLNDLTETDKRFLENDCGLKKVFDLRSNDEIKKDPDVKMAGVDIEHIDILASSQTNGASGASMEGFLESDNINQTMLDVYTQLVVSDSALKGYSKFLKEIVTIKQPILFHCFAGKDRTGYAASLLLEIAGATEEQIFVDYLYTNIERRDENRKIVKSFQNKLDVNQLKSLKIALDVDKSYLQHARKTVIKEFGSFENYLTTGLKLDKDYTQQFRDMYIVNI